jgi:hypothetical protein
VYPTEQSHKGKFDVASEQLKHFVAVVSHSLHFWWHLLQEDTDSSKYPELHEQATFCSRFADVLHVVHSVELEQVRQL